MTLNIKQNNLILFFIAIFIALNNIIIGYKIFGISIDRIFEIIIFLILIKSFLQDLKTKEELRFLLNIFLLLFAFKIFENFSSLFQGENLTLKEFIVISIRIFSMYIFFYLSYLLFQNKKDGLINIMLSVYFLAFLLGFFQNFLTPLTEFSWMIKYTFFQNNIVGDAANNFKTIITSNININEYDGRISGPYGSTITLTYTLITAAMISSYYFIKKEKNIYFFLLIFIFVVAILSLTRSVILPIALFLLLIFFFKINKKSYLIGLLILFLILFYFLVDFILNNDYFLRLINGSADESSSGKFPLLITGVVALVKYPLGITEMQYQEVKELMFLDFNHPHVLIYNAHNAFVNFGFHYSFLGYIVFIYFIIKLITYLKVFPKKDKLIWIVFAIGYSFHQFFHNSGILIDDFNILIILALFFSEYKNNRKRIKK